MSKKYFYLFLLNALLFNDVFSQSMGFVYESTSFNLNNLFFHSADSHDGLIKTFSFNFNGPLDDNFILSARLGFGWYNEESVYNSEYQGKTVNKENISGIPIEVEIKYQHFIESNSVFEPTISLGMGYYNFTAKLKSGSSNITKYLIDGFAQYIAFGMNIHMTKSLMSSIQFKNIMTNSITTRRNEENSYTERDYLQGSGFDNFSISIGIYQKLNIME